MLPNNHILDAMCNDLANAKDYEVISNSGFYKGECIAKDLKGTWEYNKKTGEMIMTIQATWTKPLRYVEINTKFDLQGE